eukprot:CAMPEP_0114673316 /NCGR_PEP_ID=MMETSP0191-20121206/44501_1 /TAXON_ID=126664 /ORGANISM="Sorites sp." /LENGTH=286 /DNA_ID=CAMNT_0001937967 /DNA_START=400 /DNA_END=1260 /DNA_ORIENTATION=+
MKPNDPKYSFNNIDGISDNATHKSMDIDMEFEGDRPTGTQLSNDISFKDLEAIKQAFMDNSNQPKRYNQPKQYPLSKMEAYNDDPNMADDTTTEATTINAHSHPHRHSHASTDTDSTTDSDSSSECNTEYTATIEMILKDEVKDGYQPNPMNINAVKLLNNDYFVRSIKNPQHRQNAMNFLTIQHGLIQEMIANHQTTKGINNNDLELLQDLLHKQQNALAKLRKVDEDEEKRVELSTQTRTYNPDLMTLGGASQYSGASGTSGTRQVVQVVRVEVHLKVVLLVQV